MLVPSTCTADATIEVRIPYYLPNHAHHEIDHLGNHGKFGGDVAQGKGKRAARRSRRGRKGKGKGKKGKSYTSTPLEEVD